MNKKDIDALKKESGAFIKEVVKEIPKEERAQERAVDIANIFEILSDKKNPTQSG